MRPNSRQDTGTASTKLSAGAECHFTALSLSPAALCSLLQACYKEKLLGDSGVDLGRSLPEVAVLGHVEKDRAGFERT